MQRSEQINELASALAKAQGEFKPIIKNRTVTVSGITKSGKPFSYDFDYADLDAILSAVRPALSANGLALLQAVGERKLSTMLTHSSGQWISEEVPFVTDGMTIQDIGKQITYMRRYQQVAILNLSAEDDDDGGKTEGMESKQMKVRGSGVNGPGVHKPDDGAKEALTEAQKLKVQGVVDEAMNCVDRSPSEALAILEGAKFELIEESLYAWGFFSAAQRRAMKAAKVALKATA